MIDDDGVCPFKTFANRENNHDDAKANDKDGNTPV